MNIAYHYPKIFWNTACLTVNAGADEGNDDNKTTNYGKIAKAISNITNQGQKIALPDINRAKFGFTPDMNTNEIVFSLKGVNGVGDDIAKAIVTNQPYVSIKDFQEKMLAYKSEDKDRKFGEGNMITLIKAGCFDALENKPRTEIMSEYISSVSNRVSSLTIASMEILKSLHLLTETQERYEYRIYKYKDYVLQKKFFAYSNGKSASTNFYTLEPIYALPFFNEEFESDMTLGKDYVINDNGEYLIKRGSLDRECDKKLTDFKTNVLKSSDILLKVNEYKFNEKWNEKASGTISSWEMDSLSFYYHKHELADVNVQKYLIEDFNKMSETPVIIDYYKRKDKDIPRFQLFRICGTVLDKNKNRHTITLLTPTGVVTVKFYKGQFSFYDKQISEIKDDGKKTVLEKSWFTRGNKLLITGIRRGDQFVPKKYKDSVYKHTVQTIIGVDEEGNLELISERSGYEDNE